LLVVIGIIALLISILLPALGKARAQANLMYCASNLRAIGQLVQIYCAENNNWAPMAAGITPAIPDTLTLLTQNPRKPQAQTGNNSFRPQDYLAIFHDVDVPSMPWGSRAQAYQANVVYLVPVVA